MSRATLTVRRFSDYGYSSGTTRYAFSLDPPMLYVRDFYVRHDVRQAVRIDDAVYFIVSDRSRSFILALSSVSRYADADAYEMRVAIEEYLQPEPTTTTSSHGDSGALDFLLRRMNLKPDFPAISQTVTDIIENTETPKPQENTENTEYTENTGNTDKNRKHRKQC